MKSKSKLGIFMVCFVTVPLIIINIIISNNIKNQNTDSFKNNITKITKMQTDQIGLVLEEDLNSAKEFASLNYVKKFAELSNGDSVSNIEQYNESMSKSLMQLDITKKFHIGVEESFLTNNKGKVIASTNNKVIGEIFPNFDFINKIAAGSGGISGFSMQDINGNKIPVYYIVRNIYSDNNAKQGLFVQICNANRFKNIVSSSDIYKSSDTVIVDNNGNVFKYPFTEIKMYNDFSEYDRIHSFIKDSINTDDKVSKSNFVDFKRNGEKAKAYNIVIPNSSWSLIVSVEESGIYGDSHQALSSIKLNTFNLLFISIILIILFVYKFTKPIDSIVEVLIKKQRGDQNARFVVMSNDEFGEIGRAFNTMFDDVFESEQRYRTIVEMTDNIVFEINFRKNSVFISNNFNQKYSFRPRSDNLQDSFFYKGRIHKDDKDRFAQDFERVLADSNYLQGEYRFKNIYGDFAWVLIRGTKFFDRDESPTKIIGVMVDIDREKKSEMHLLQRANFDALTQLYNRETFIKTLTSEFELAKMRKTLDAVLFIDLDDFKHFNDEYGHSCGDEVLKFTADTIKEIVFDKGFAGRFGGDEFVICLNNQKYFGDPGKVAQDIIDVLGKGFVSDSVDKKLTINCSIGIAFFNENGKNCEEVLNSADEAMYSIKKHGKSNFGYVSAHQAPTEIKEIEV